MTEEAQNIPLSSIQGMEELLNMTEEQQQAWFQAGFEEMSFEDQAWFLKYLHDALGEE